MFFSKGLIKFTTRWSDSSQRVTLWLCPKHIKRKRVLYHMPYTTSAWFYLRLNGNSNEPVIAVLAAKFKKYPSELPQIGSPNFILHVQGDHATMCSRNMKLKRTNNNLQCFHLITKYEVAKAEVNQYKWENQRSYNEVREPKKSKQENPRNFAMVAHRFSFWVIPLATRCTNPPQVVQNSRRLSDFWRYTCPRSHHICNKKRCLQNNHETNNCLATHKIWQWLIHRTQQQIV